MAPTLASNGISDLEVSSLELDARATIPEMLSHPQKRDSSILSLSDEMSHSLAARDGANVIQPSYGGAVDPNDINMKGIQALFALIGFGFVLGIIWFFFWAKNGGFHWRKGDWDDYKSTVLRRKGPNGTTLSNATKSTILGGGSVVGEGYSDGSGSTVDETMTETMTELSSNAPIMREKRMRQETAKERKIREARAAQFEGGHDNDVLAYIKEKPARVGGINKDSDALHYGTDYTETEASVVQGHHSDRGFAPRTGSSSRQPSPEKRSARRDFSYGNDEAFSTVSGSQPDRQPIEYPEVPAPVQFAEAPPPTPPHRPGRYHSPSKQFQQDATRRSGQYPRGGTYSAEASVVSEAQSQNTKTYHHPLPSLSGQNPARGYRRDRRDSFDD